MPFQKEPASWDLPFHPISSTQAQKRLQRKVFTKRVENHWQMFPRGVVDAHPWKCSVIPGSIQDSEEAVLIEYGPAHCGAVGPGGLERSLSAQLVYDSVIYGNQKLCDFSAAGKKAALELIQKGSRQGYPWKAKCPQSVGLAAQTRQRPSRLGLSRQHKREEPFLVHALGEANWVYSFIAF